MAGRRTWVSRAPPARLTRPAFASRLDNAGDLIKKARRKSKEIADEMLKLSGDSLEDAFNQFDADGSGELDEDELHAALKTAGREIDEGALKAAIKEFDTNNDGARHDRPRAAQSRAEPSHAPSSSWMRMRVAPSVPGDDGRFSPHAHAVVGVGASAGKIDLEEFKAIGTNMAKKVAEREQVRLHG